MKFEMKKLEDAYIDYGLIQKVNIESDVLNYAIERIRANKKVIEQMLKKNNSLETFDRINKVLSKFENIEILYKQDNKLEKHSEGFVSSIITTSIGIVCVETSDLYKCIEFLLNALITRNAIVISDMEFEELDIKHAILLIIREALKKYGISEDLVNILPPEEIDTGKMDLILDGENVTVKNKEQIIYVCLESDELQAQALNEKQILRDKGYFVNYIEGNIENILSTIIHHRLESAVIFTNNVKNGLKFMNVVNADNVFVNVSPLFYKDFNNDYNDLLIKKNIVFVNKNFMK